MDYFALPGRSCENQKPLRRKVRTSSHHLWTEERAIHGKSMYMIRLIVLGIKVFGLSRKKSEIFSISLIYHFMKPREISAYWDNSYTRRKMLSEFLSE